MKNVRPEKLVREGTFSGEIPEEKRKNQDARRGEERKGREKKSGQVGKFSERGNRVAQ